MIKTSEVLDAINSALVKKFNCTVYIDFMPEDFERPSFFLTLISEKTSDVNRYTVERTKNFKLICYESKNEYFLSSSLDLIRMQEEACILFETGKLQVKDRMLNISTAVETELSTDTIFINIEVKFFDDRCIEKEKNEIMKTLNLDVKEE